MNKNVIKRIGLMGLVASMGFLTNAYANNLDIMNIRTAYKTTHCEIKVTFKNTGGNLSDEEYNQYTYMLAKDNQMVGQAYMLGHIDQGGVLKNLGGQVQFIHLSHADNAAVALPEHETRKIAINDTAVVNITLQDKIERKSKEVTLTCKVPKLDPKMMSPKVKTIKKPTLSPAVDVDKLKMK